MAFDGRAYAFADDQPDARAAGRFTTAPQPNMKNDIGLCATYSVLHRCIKFTRPPHAVACGKHRKTRRYDQADNARRPLRRRLDTIARPARLRIRRRKPCTRARRRLFGWKVRFPLATAFSSLYHHPAAHASQVRRSGVVLLLAGAVPKHIFLGRSRIADFRATV